MFYPSGTTEVSGDDPDDVALIGAAVAKGIYGPRPLQTVAHEVHSVNGATTDPQLPLPDPPPKHIAEKPHDHSPFIDLSVTRYHPAILALEQHILAPTDRLPTTYEYHWMRCFVGYQITGVWRECQTRAVGTLMARLVETGVVIPLGNGKWEKAVQLP
jgi:hypothetical protein